MDFRNIKRTACFGRSLYKYNKKSDAKLTPLNVFLLLAIYELSKRRPCTSFEIQDYLKRIKHTCSSNVINSNIKLFKEQGWVDVIGSYPSLYSITFHGISELNELEKRVRVERTDK